jgi:hypothetical protein
MPQARIHVTYSCGITVDGKFFASKARPLWRCVTTLACALCYTLRTLSPTTSITLGK